MTTVRAGLTKERVFQSLVEMAVAKDIGDAEELQKQITYDTRFIDDLAADSLDIVELIMSAEDMWEVDFPDEALEDVRTFGEAAETIIRVCNA